MPFAGHKDFDACVLSMKGKGHSEEEARKFCGKMQKDAEKAAMMADFNNQWVEIFRVGDYGPKGKYDTEFVQKLVANFQPELWKAPATLNDAAKAQIGHADEAPAMGWVRELKAEGGSLKARFEKVHPALENLAREGRFPNRSASFYLNPQGKGPMLRHVAFLGASPPEVKGLAPIQFEESGEFVEIEFSEIESSETKEEQMEIGDIKKVFVEALQELGISKKKEETTPPAKTFSEAEVAAQVKAAADQAKADAEKEFKEKERTAEARRTRSTEVQAFLDPLRRAGKYIPAFDKLGVAAFMESLSGEAAIEFGEAGKTEKKSQFEIFKGLLSGLPKIVEFGERAGDKKTANTPAEFAANTAAGVVVDPHSVKLLARANELMREKKDLKFEEAAAQARTEIGDREQVV